MCARVNMQLARKINEAKPHTFIHWFTFNDVNKVNGEREGERERGEIERGQREEHSDVRFSQAIKRWILHVQSHTYHVILPTQFMDKFPFNSIECDVNEHVFAEYMQHNPFSLASDR